MGWSAQARAAAAASRKRKGVGRQVEKTIPGLNIGHSHPDAMKLDSSLAKADAAFRTHGRKDVPHPRLRKAFRSGGPDALQAKLQGHADTHLELHQRDGNTSQADTLGKHLDNVYHHLDNVYKHAKH